MIYIKDGTPGKERNWTNIKEFEGFKDPKCVISGLFSVGNSTERFKIEL